MSDKIRELRTDIENEISGVKLQIRKKQEESRILRREWELLGERKHKLMDLLDKIDKD